jgi:hypothetical protein
MYKNAEIQAMGGPFYVKPALSGVYFRISRRPLARRYVGGQVCRGCMSESENDSEREKALGDELCEARARPGRIRVDR